MIPAADRPTTEERYVRATSSAHLEMREGRGDVDALIAAGWVRDGLGTQLYRLRCEWDAVRQDSSHATTATDLALLLMRLSTLRPARDALGAWAQQEAVRWAVRQVPGAHRWRQVTPQRRALLEQAVQGFTPQVIAALTGHVLRAHLDPLCRHCNGLGYTGGYGAPNVACRSCRSTGQAKATLGNSDTQHRFALHLLAQMEALLSEVSGAMRRFLRTGDMVT